MLIKDAFAATAAAKSLRLCPTVCDPIDSRPPGSPVPGILQARTLEWVAISFSNASKWKLKVKSLSRVRLLVTPWTAAYQALPPWDFPGKSAGVGCHCLLRRMLLLVDKAGLISLFVQGQIHQTGISEHYKLGELLIAVLQKSFLRSIHLGNMTYPIPSWRFPSTLLCCFQSFLCTRIIQIKIKAEMIFESKKSSQSLATHCKEYLPLTMKFKQKYCSTLS